MYEAESIPAASAGDDSVRTSLGDIPVRSRPCPCCGAENGDGSAGRYSRPPWLIKTCSDCGFTYLDPVPLYEALEETLSWEKSLDAESERRTAARPLLRRITFAARVARRRYSLLPRRRTGHVVARWVRPGPILDVGCSDGSHAVALPEGFVPYGIEVSASLAAVADESFSRRGGRCVHAAALRGVRGFADRTFIGAIMRSYLEHEIRPGAVLAALRAKLAPGAAVVVKVPNYASLNRRLMGRRWCGFRVPEHVNYFTPATLTELARRAGYATHFTAFGAVPTNDSMWAVLRPFSDEPVLAASPPGAAAGSGRCSRR